MHSHPEQLAWRILLTAFMIFILLCSTAVYVAQWFVFQSSEPMLVELRVARGTAGVASQNVQDVRYVPGSFQLETLPSTILTDANSQSTVTFSDPHTQIPIVSVILYRNSQISVTIASAPRFGLNQASYLIELADMSGRAEVLVLEGVERNAEIEIHSPFTTAQLGQPGRYLIVASTQQTEFSTLSGEAILLTTSGAELPITTNQKTVVKGTSSEIAVTEGDTMLLENSYFQEDLNIGWVPYNDADAGEPEGYIYNGVYTGRSVLVIDRAGFNFPNRILGHGADGVVQKISLDVSEYSSLSIRASFYIAEQSLSQCGIDGSECPIMIHLKFIDELGTTRDFIQGFYAFDDATNPSPESCQSCRFPHDRISLGSWFTYQSANLIEVFADSRPMTLKEISLYASGHAYKVYISELNLIAIKPEATEASEGQ